MAAIEMRKPAPVWDARKLLTAAGTPLQLRRLLKMQGWDVPAPQQVYQWKSRNHVPPRWALLIAYALLQAGKAKLSQLIEIKAQPPCAERMGEGEGA